MSATVLPLNSSGLISPAYPMLTEDYVVPRLTKSVVDRLKTTSGERVYWDDQIPGFGVRVKLSGSKSWLIQYRNQHGQSRRMTLGRCSVLTPDQARTKAKLDLASVASGADPAAVKRQKRSAILVSQLCDDYLESGKGRIKDSTLRVDRSRIERHVKPLLGSRPVASLTPADMDKFLADVIAGRSAPKPPAKAVGNAKKPRGGKTTGGPSVASRTLGMLGTILQRAVRDGVLAKNPTHGIAKPKDQTKAPPFAFASIAALGKAMREAQNVGENIVGIRAIRFLLTSGCRRNECLTLQWDEVDRSAQCLRLKDTKSGKQNRPVALLVIDTLLSFKPSSAKPADYVFLGGSSKGHFVGLPKVWERIAAKAGIADVSLHGLRHWFASAAAEMNYSELTISGLLGHKVKGVTARYANAPDSAFLAAADKVAERLQQEFDRL